MMECFKVHIDEIEGRINPLYLKNKLILEDLQPQFKLVRLGSLLKCKVQYGANESAIDGNPKEDVRYIRITDIDEFGNLKNDAWKTSQNIEKKYELNEGDILFARSGATAGKCFFYKNEYDKSIFAGYLIRFKFNEEKVNPKYVFYYSQLKHYKLWVISIQRPSGQPNINSEEFKSFKIPLPPIEVQNRIVNIMDEAYKTKEQKETKKKRLLNSINDYVLDRLGIKLSRLKDKMTYVAYADNLNGTRIDAYYHQPKFEVIEEAINNGKFEVKTLKNFITKIHYGASVKNTYVNEGIPLLRILNIKENKVNLSDVVKLPELMRKELRNAFVKEGDLLISRSGSVGIVSVIPKEAEGYAFGSFMIKFCLNEKINKNYVSMWLNTKVQKLLTEREKIGAIQGNITIGTINNFKIPVSPLSVQYKITEEVKKRMQKAEQLQKESKNALEKAKLKFERIIFGEEKI